MYDIVGIRCILSADGTKIVIIPSTLYTLYNIWYAREERGGGLHGREVHPRDATIEVEGVDVGHP